MESKLLKYLVLFFPREKTVGTGSGYTIPAPASQANHRINYIFYANGKTAGNGPELRPVHAEVINTGASDHLPVYAEFEIVNEEPTEK